MKKFLLPLFSLVVAFSISAAGFKKPMAVNANVSPLAESDVNELPMGYLLSALYDDVNYLVPNFYIILSSDANSRYDSNTGDISAAPNTFTLILDLFAMADDDNNTLPVGTYTMLQDDDDPHVFGYTHEYSMLNFYDYSSGQISLQLENPIEVSRNADGSYHITTLVSDAEDNLMRVSYDGPLVMRSATEKQTVYPQIKSNVEANLNKGGVAYYQGVTDYSNYGVTMLNLYDVDFDAETGAMKGEGTHLCMMFAHKRYRKADYTLAEGEYTNATNLNRDTWYPAREISYMGATYPFGSYLRQMKVVNGQNTYTYAYLKSGKFTIVDNGNGTFTGTLEAETTLGYTVKATWSGPIVLDTSAASVPPAVSDLSDDVIFDFSPLDFGRIYHSGIQGGCRTLIVDLGSPSGKDESIIYGGDLLRMEFLVDPEFTRLNSGVYTVVPRRWNSDELRAGGTYEPGSLNKGYFDGQGAQIGTRYAHFEEGRWGVYDMVGPAEEGQVIVETDDYETYHFTINLLDDAGFKMEGEWNKPIQYCYDPEAIEIPGLSGIDAVGSDNNDVKVMIDGSNLLILNADDQAVALYDVEGRLVKSAVAGNVIPVDGLAKGIYLVKVKNTTIKVAL